MISKSYFCSLNYGSDVSAMLDKWVWTSREVEIFVGRELIGRLRPIRWWRHDKRKEYGPPISEAILCFSIKRKIDAKFGVGDFCGDRHYVRLEVKNGEVEYAEVVKT